MYIASMPSFLQLVACLRIKFGNVEGMLGYKSGNEGKSSNCFSRNGLYYHYLELCFC